MNTSLSRQLLHLFGVLAAACVLVGATAAPAYGQDWSNTADPTDRDYSWSALMGGGFAECFNFRVWELPLKDECFGDANKEDTNRETTHSAKQGTKGIFGQVGAVIVEIKHIISQVRDVENLVNQFKNLFKDFDLENAERTVYRLSQSSDRMETRMDQTEMIHSSIPSVVSDNRYDKIAVFADRAFAALQEAEDFQGTFSEDIAEGYRNLGYGSVSIRHPSTDSASDSTANRANLPPLASRDLPPAELNVYQHPESLIYPQAALQAAASSSGDGIDPTERPVSYYMRHRTQTTGNNMTAQAVQVDISRWDQIISTLRQREAVYEEEKDWAALYTSFERF